MVSWPTLLKVAASMQKETESIPSYPNLPSKLICLLQNVTIHADPETDEVYAQMTLLPVKEYNRDALLASDMALKQSRQPAEFFCKNLTASDTSTHGGFSVPRRAAEKIFPPLDFSMQPPCQELVAKDLHNQAWTFRHIYRGQPKRHLLTTGWSVFVSSKKLFAGDSVLFVRDEKSQLLLGIRRANKQQVTLASSVISSDSMHIGVFAAAAHAVANNSPFTVFYNPRASPAEFVVPLAKYNKAMYTQVSLGMRFRMMFETEECGVRRNMGTVTGISDLDAARWKNSQWRNLQVGWDESTAGERPSRVSIWEIEPVVTPFYICPPPFFRPKFPNQPGLPGGESDIESIFKRGLPWMGGDLGMKDVPALSLVQWMNMQQSNQLPGAQPGLFSSMVAASALHGGLTPDDPSKLLSFQSPSFSVPGIPFNKTPQQNQQLQQTLQNPLNQQQQQEQFLQQHQQVQQQQQQVLHNSLNSQEQKLQEQHQFQKQQQQYPTAPQKHQIPNSTFVNSGNVTPYQNLVQSSMYSQLQQHQSAGGHNQTPQNCPTNKDSVTLSSLPPVVQFQQQRTPPVLQSLSDNQLQLHLLQKVQQQPRQQSNQVASPPVLQNLSSSRNPTPQVRTVQHHGMPKTTIASSLSDPTDGDAPSCSTSPSMNNSQITPPSFLNNPQGHNMNMVVDRPVHENGKLMKHEISSSKVVESPRYHGTIGDPLEASSSVNSYGLDASGFQHNLSLPNLGVDGDVQSHPRTCLPISTTIDSLIPDTLLSRADYSSCGKDIEAELSAAAMSSQTFGMHDIPPFKSGCSSDVVINDPSILGGGGIWPGQTQRMRTYTKVQKRGSVGRCIDVTRYTGYDELRRDLAHMFGIDRMLEDPHRTDWKMVYVDHKNDILLVGDDPWDEFVNCVQSIKILSYAEVQQMSLDGDLGSEPIPNQNQTSSGADSGNNAWRGYYDDNSAASFN